MQDVRWPLLRGLLIEDGWVWRGNTLCAPHDTMWFTTRAGEPNQAEFRDRLSESCDEVDRRDLHADLVSLVAALDTVLRGN